MRAALNACLLSVVLGACADRPDAAAEPFELRDVVRERLDELARDVGPAPEIPPLAPELEEEVDGMVTMLAGSDERMRSIPIATIRDDVGPAAVPRLAAALASDRLPAEERVAAAELLASLNHPAATEALLGQLSNAPEAWLRRWCAWHLASVPDDAVVPRLLFRLKYESDHEAVVWLATALGRHRNYAGAAVLADLARSSPSESVRTQAAQQLAELASDAGCGPDELAPTWSSVDAGRLPQPSPSPRLQQAAWLLVSQMSSEHFQLRGVDDARYVLSHMGAWVADEVAQALADSDDHTRLHAAQVLERMGPRAVSAGPALVKALADASVAPTAAEALGRVGYPPAVAALAARTAPEEPHELRVAAVRALGRTGVADGLAAVRPCFAEAGNPHDLRLAAATALVLLGAGDEAAPWLVGELPDFDDAEVALETWLAAGAERGRSGFAEALAAWREDAGPPGVIPTLEAAAARRRSRAARLAPVLDELLAQ